MDTVRVTFKSGAGELLIIQNFNLFQLTKAEREFVSGLSDYVAAHLSRSGDGVNPHPAPPSTIDPTSKQAQS